MYFFSTDNAKFWPIVAVLPQIYALLGVLLQLCPCPAWTLWVCPWTPISIKVSPKFCPSIIQVVSKYWTNNSQVVPKYCPSIDQVVSSNAQIVTNLSLSIAGVLYSRSQVALKCCSSSAQVALMWCPSIAQVVQTYYSNSVQAFRPDKTSKPVLTKCLPDKTSKAGRS